MHPEEDGYMSVWSMAGSSPLPEVSKQPATDSHLGVAGDAKIVKPSEVGEVGCCDRITNVLRGISCGRDDPLVGCVVLIVFVLLMVVLWLFVDWATQIPPVDAETIRAAHGGQQSL